MNEKEEGAVVALAAHVVELSSMVVAMAQKPDPSLEVGPPRGEAVSTAEPPVSALQHKVVVGRLERSEADVEKLSQELALKEDKRERWSFAWSEGTPTEPGVYLYSGGLKKRDTKTQAYIDEIDESALESDMYAGFSVAKFWEDPQDPDKGLHWAFMDGHLIEKWYKLA